MIKIPRFLKSKKKKFLVLDFGSSAVKGLLFEKKSLTKEKIKIKKFFCENIKKFGIFRTKNFDLTTILKAAKKTIKKLGIQKEELVDTEVLITFGSEILKGKIVSIFLKRNNPKDKINSQENQNIKGYAILKARKKFFKEVLAEDSILPQETHIFRQKIIEKRISGYKISCLDGSQGEDLSFKVLFVFTTKDYLEKINKIKSCLNFEKADIFHEVEGLIYLLQLNPDLKGMFVDVGNQHSQVFSIKEEPEFISEILIGGGSFSQKLSQQLKISKNQAEELKAKFSKGELTDAAAKKIKGIFVPIFSKWQKDFDKKTKKKKEISFYSFQKIYFFGGGAFLPGFKNIIKVENFVEILNIKKLPLKIEPKLILNAQSIPAVFLSFCVFLKKNDKKNY